MLNITDVGTNQFNVASTGPFIVGAGSPTCFTSTMTVTSTQTMTLTTVLMMTITQSPFLWPTQGTTQAQSTALGASNLSSSGFNSKNDVIIASTILGTLLLLAGLWIMRLKLRHGMPNGPSDPNHLQSESPPPMSQSGFFIPPEYRREHPPADPFKQNTPRNSIAESDEPST